MTDLLNGYTKEQLHEAFDLVKNDENWKMPIDALLPIELVDKEVLSFSVMFFTGEYPIIEESDIPSMLRITAPGYYMTIGA